MVAGREGMLGGGDGWKRDDWEGSCLGKEGGAGG